jgi:uncharacterized protein (DUF1697 family)
MSHIVLLRAANVGGKNIFRPAELAKRLAHLDVINVGAAGTFVVRGRATPRRIRYEFLATIPFQPEITILPASELLALVRSKPFAGVTFSKDVRGWIAALAMPTKARPKLPVQRPAGTAWSVRFDRVEGQFALGLWRLPTGGFVFPSHVVEAALGVSATTRWWETFERIADLV